MISSFIGRLKHTAVSHAARRVNALLPVWQQRCECGGINAPSKSLIEDNLFLYLLKHPSEPKLRQITCEMFFQLFTLETQ